MTELDRDSLKGKRLPYLDKGYVQLIDFLGSDYLISMFARASFAQDGFKSGEEDAKLLNLIDYLVKHKHTSPIEAGEIVFQMKIPLFVRDQLVRHRTASLNIQSLRYAPHDGDYYVPPRDRYRDQDQFNKQGSGDLLLKEVADAYAELIDEHSSKSYALYEKLIQGGLARETARVVLPTNFYTTLCWKMDTKNLMNFLKLRDDGHAQPEIQELARCVDYFYSQLFPKTHSAYVEFIKLSQELPQTESEILKELIHTLSNIVFEDTYSKEAGDSSLEFQAWIDQSVKMLASNKNLTKRRTTELLNFINNR